MEELSRTLRASLFWRTGLSTGFYLGLSVPVLMFIVFQVADSVPMTHTVEMALPILLLAATLGGLGLAGSLWGRTLARQTGVPHARRLAWVGGLLFGPLTLAAAQALGQAELVLVEGRLARTLPVHVSFALVFTLAAFAVTAGMALGVGWAARGWRFGLGVALWAGLAAAAAFLFADVVQDLLGRRVGAPGAERTLTMLSVALLGNLVAAFVGGGVLGRKLAAHAHEPTTAEPSLEAARPRTGAAA